MGAWTEREREGSGSLTIDFEALDAEQTERNEIASFQRALTAPRNDPNAFTDRYGVKRSSLDVAREIVGLASIVGAVGLCGVFGWLVKMLAIDPPLLAWAVVFLAGVILPQIGLSYLYGRSRARFKKVRAKFTLTLDADGFIVEREGKPAAQKIELDAIECFEAQRRIALIDKSGRRVLLPLSLATPAENEALADRLNAAIIEARASRGGYRGGGPRIATPELEPLSEEPTDEARVRERR